MSKVVSARILFQDEHFVAVDKPSGWLVHPSAYSGDRAASSCMAEVRDQIGKFVYPVHRLDRSTSGVLIFGLSSEAASALGALFSDRALSKRYYAIVRGYVDES